MEQKVKELVNQIVSDHCLKDQILQNSASTFHRFMIGVFGTPGSSKTTTSEIMKNCFINDFSIPTQIIPMDGFHYYRKELDVMENPQHAHSRRGAPFTFNDKAFEELLKKVKYQTTQLVKAPSFDHHIGDPIEEDIIVDLSHRVIIVEGNYLATWNNIRPLFDVLIYIYTASKEEAMERVVRRHMSTGNSEELARQRVNFNDGPNADQIISDFNRIRNEYDQTMTSPRKLYTLLSEHEDKFAIK
ncbi:hypothetical protein FDP41_003445 [Naegleria fowleri]|uniref:Phosphoribulokinase/uridine kinase domain-containing protein n=1 Tax=Naegleria fowleri TaxID=5763 RepID=A0A6A5BHV9_NAEFO|nr:uncharacterized protein FDP41_003445 [Naegleria fowleri]KAF0977453.1 hypothetical protein FDP41_003445 [Naegleria fowleri]CAG4711239.1 unnamed protein product [Naegleria fowleri]